MDIDDIDPEVLQVEVNFQEEMFARYREVIEERLEGKSMRNPRRIDQIGLEKFPGWNRAVIVRLRSLFHIFDEASNGLIDFKEL